jgi:DNA polymerase delta subunit 4
MEKRQPAKASNPLGFKAKKQTRLSFAKGKKVSYVESEGETSGSQTDYKQSQELLGASQDSVPKSSQESPTARRIANVKASAVVPLRQDVKYMLKQFDLDSRFGPCIGLSRIERWNRAEKLGLNPDLQIKEMAEMSGNKEALWHGIL